MNEIKNEIKLIVLDCDGVLAKGEAHPFEASLLARLAALNRRARRGEAVPAVTLNTGRPSPYIEAVMQAIDGRLPAPYENGAGLYRPELYQLELTPALHAVHKRALRAIIAEIDRAIVQPGLAYWQPGKTVCHTLFARPPGAIADFSHEVTAIIAQVSDQFTATPAKLALNVHPLGIDKGTGLHWLSQVTGIAPAEMGGVGDTSGDISFLRLAGHSAAPSNATDDVKGVVHYLSPDPDATGLSDILDHWSLP